MPRYEWIWGPNTCILGALDLGVQVSGGSNYTPTPACNIAHATDYSHMTLRRSPWQHILSMCIMLQNGESDTPIRKMRCTRPRLNRCPDNTKLACHRRTRYKMEWIYTQAKVRSLGNIELAREKKKTRRLRFTFYNFFTQLIQAYPIVSMDGLGLDR